MIDWTARAWWLVRVGYRWGTWDCGTLGGVARMGTLGGAVGCVGTLGGDVGGLRGVGALMVAEKMSERWPRALRVLVSIGA
jgi:hypothetical protein